MGWLIAMIFAVLTFAALYLSKRCSRLSLELTGAVILIALAGYGWQGSPDMPGNPVSPPAAAAN
jgi:cytochrome c-type biogenesis protein CcmH